MVKPVYQRLIDVDGNFTYVGEAIPGTAPNSSSWRIKRVSDNSPDMTIIWGDGTANFNKVWSNRTSYDYGVNFVPVLGNFNIGSYNSGAYN